MGNRCVFVGRLVKDPELFETNNNVICRFTLAVKRDFPTGKNQADFINFSAFNRTAEYISGYGKKGMLCYAESRFQTFVKNGTDPAEKPENGYNFIVDKFEILSSKKELQEYNNKEEIGVSPYFSTPPQKKQEEQKQVKRQEKIQVVPFSDDDDFDDIPF